MPLAACDEADPPPAGPDTDVTAAGGEAAAARAHHTGPPWDAPGQQVPLEAGNPITDLNELFAFIALEEPGGFAGVHVEDDRFVIQMVEPGRARGGAMRWIRQFYGEQLREMPVEFRRADRSFADLMSWYRTFQNIVFAHGAVWTDIRESANRLEAGLEPGSDFEGVREALTGAGIPENLYGLVPDRPLPPSKTLDDRFRPPLGGVKINGEGSCTLGFNVRHWDVGRGFVTAAHCTGRMGSVEDEVFEQPLFDTSIDNRVGVEVIDPGFWTGTNSFTGDTCPAEFSGGCRYADAALIAYDTEMADSLGYLARPKCVDCSTDQLVIDDADPTVRLTDETHTFAEGQNIGKIGQNTGWTTGEVDKTCAEHNLGSHDDELPEVDLYPPDTGLLCQIDIEPVNSFYSMGGDSGSPVIDSTLTSTSARLFGIHWAGDGNSAIASRITGVRNDLDPNGSLECDGLETLAGGGCDGGDGSFQECTGDRESFQCEADGSL